MKKQLFKVIRVNAPHVTFFCYDASKYLLHHIIRIIRKLKIKPPFEKNNLK